MADVSIIVPCYNMGKYIEETIQSIQRQTCQNIETIIVNDGSTDKQTLSWLDQCKFPQTQVIHTQNRGLAAARNKGISQSQGQYIVCLDADDKIAPEYIEKARQVLIDRPDAGIVYSLAELFGVDQGVWELPEYSFPEILEGNMFFNAAMYRKHDWEIVGGYSEDMKHGWQDYEFWLKLIELKREVVRIPEVLFYYRTRHDAMHRKVSGGTKHLVENKMMIYKKHRKMYQEQMDYIYENYTNLMKSYRVLVETHERQIRFWKMTSVLLPIVMIQKLYNKFKRYNRSEK